MASIAVPPDVDVDRDADRFAIPVGRVRRIADEVWKAEPKLTVTVFEREGELRHFYRAEFARQLHDRRTCNWQGCTYRYGTMEAAIAHQLLHLGFDITDRRTQRAVLNDIRELLNPPRETRVSGQVAGVLTDEEIAAIDLELEECEDEQS